MDKFANIDTAAHTGANGHNHKRPATPGQQAEGNYEKGRETLYGLRIAIETPRGTLREWRAADGTSGSNLMKFHYGYIMGTLGNDGDELDVSIGPWPESPRAYVVNQNHVGGGFDEHKIMLGFPDQRTAVAGYMSNYSAGWTGFGSCVACSIAQLKWWIANGNKTRPLTKDQLPYEGTDDTMEKVIWDSANKPLRKTLDQVLYALRGHDGSDGLLYDAVSIADILADSDGVLTLDALVIPFARIQQRMALMQKVLDRTGKAVKVAAMQVSDPFTQRGTTNVAVVYELSDGQTVSVFFHNPDVTPKKIAAGDDVVSWKWMLNKKDITVAVAPEKGRDLDVRTVAARIMQLAEKNSARFAAANGKRAEKLEVITGLKGELETKQATLADLEQKVEAAQAARDAAGLDEPPEPVIPEPEPEPAPAPAALDVDSIKGVVTYSDPMDGVPHGADWVIMNAPRPLMGTETMSDGEFLTGRFYAAIDPADSMARAYIDANVKLDASVVFIADQATQNMMALNTINPEYLPAYMEMSEAERTPALSGFVQKLHGRTYGQLKELAAKGMPVADMWRRDVEAFAFNRPGFFGRAIGYMGNSIINQKPAGTWTISKMGDGTFAAFFSTGDGKYVQAERSETIEGAHAAMLADPAYIAATAPAPEPEVTWRSKYLVAEIHERFRVAGVESGNPISPSYPTRDEAEAAAAAYFGGADDFPAPTDSDAFRDQENAKRAAEQAASEAAEQAARDAEQARMVAEQANREAEAAAQAEAAAKKAAEDQESADGDFLALAANGEVDFYDKAITDRLAGLAKKYTDPEGAYLDLIMQAKTAAKNFFVAEFKKKVG